MKINFTELVHKAAEVSVACSFIANILPKSDVFAGYPKVKRAYETFVGFVSALAINFRFRLPTLDVSVPALGLTKPPGALPPASVEEIRDGESKPGPVHPPEEAPKP